MNIIQAIILGFVQGITEFLPISSSGHLVLFQDFMQLDSHDQFFDILVHVGTLIPILIIYFEDIWALIKKPFQKTTYLLVIGTLPAVVATLLFSDQINALFSTGVFLAVGFLITSVLLLYANRPYKESKDIKDMTYTDALIIGVVQAVAIAPGISRSGSTISAATSRNVTRESAAKFSFLLSIFAILGAVVWSGKDILTGKMIINTALFVPYIAGFFAAMISGYISIRFMIKLITQRKLKYFAIYTFVLALFIFADTLFLHKMF